MDELRILQLNDYCIERILEFTEVKARISFAHTCSRFRNVFHGWSRRGYANYYLVGDVEPWELTLLSLVSESVKSLNIFADDLVSSFNDNYSKNKRNDAFSKFYNLIRSMKNLESIKIRQIYPHPITKLLLRAIHELPNVKQLHICILRHDNVGKILLQNCRSLTALRILHISKEVSSSSLRNILTFLPELQELSFYIDRSTESPLLVCYRNQRTSLTTIFDFLASKQTLRVLRVKGQITANYEAQSLANIKSLRDLDCSFNNPKLVIYLTSLTSLQSLRITYLHHIDISATYLEVIRQCKDLRFLRLFDCNINPDFVNKASEVLKQNESKNTFHLLIHGWHDTDTLNDFKAKASASNNLRLLSVTAIDLLTL
ncbi:uncharacterized protein LOC120448427 isoform X1 [Drosophila santomea]|uniref:uncharacterized protein LOC120448427 isoform X1 n=1 Tax=Drosophila santomea TaxID=129105 RepID=UPI001953D718|nr:uncharacterized protein LOC120448427 isoform X1 [Drosophila santomea]